VRTPPSPGKGLRWGKRWRKRWCTVRSIPWNVSVLVLPAGTAAGIGDAIVIHWCDETPNPVPPEWHVLEQLKTTVNFWH